MIRADMISTIGREDLTSNIENDEYSYPKAFSAASLTFAPIRNSAGRTFEKPDIRFVKDNVTVLIETKQNFTKGTGPFQKPRSLSNMDFFRHASRLLSFCNP